MTKQFIRSQIDALAKTKGAAILKKYQDQADKAKIEWLCDMKTRTAHSILCGVHDEIERNIQVIKAAGVDFDDYFRFDFEESFDRYWTIARRNVSPYGSYNGDYQKDNKHIQSIVEAYQKEARATRLEYYRIEEIIISLPAKRAFKVLVDAGIPLSEPTTQDNHAIATLAGIQFDFSKLGIEVKK